MLEHGPGKAWPGAEHVICALCFVFGGATCSCSCCNNLSCRNACVDFACLTVFICVLYTLLCLCLCFAVFLFLFLFLFSFISFCFASCLFFFCFFVLFNVIASTLVHRHTNMVTRHEDHAPHGGQRQHQPHKQHQQQQQYHFLYMYSILCTRALFFNISAADAICLGRKLDKRLGSRSLSGSGSGLTGAN